jgi:hypothetical protein
VIIVVEAKYSANEHAIDIEYDPPMSSWVLRNACLNDVIQEIDRTLAPFVNMPFTLEDSRASGTITPRFIESEVARTLRACKYRGILIASDVEPAHRSCDT